MIGLLFLILCKLGLMVLSLTVLWLASRRLVLSRSANAWLYAATAIFALLTVIGLVPWTFAIGTSHPIFFVFAALTPAIWYSVATVCNSSRHMAYNSELEQTFLRFLELAQPRKKKAPPLVLEGADWPDAPQPVFRHREVISEPVVPPLPTETMASPTPEASDVSTFAPLPDSPPVMRDRTVPVYEPVAAPAKPLSERITAPTNRLLDIARTMRKNDTSEDRRIKLLPGPNHVSLPN